MKLSADDFPKLQFSLLAAVLMIAIGAAGVYLSLNASNAAKREKMTAQAQFKDFDGKLKQVRSEENEIKQKSALFSQLQSRGVIGEEQRLEWVELLKDIREKRRLIDLQYEIDPQHPLDANPGNGFAFSASTMKVQIKLLHEEDLTRLLDDLRQRAKALIQVKSCNVSRLARGSTEDGTPAQLQADCLIDWITLREVITPAKGVKP